MGIYSKHITQQGGDNLMQGSNMCGGYCDCGDSELSKEDRKALLKEKEAILEAKLATIRHLISKASLREENADKEKSDKE